MDFDLEMEQAKYIYDMKISRLSKVSEEKVETDLSDMYDQLPKLIKLTNDDEAILNKLIEEFTIMKDKYGDERRTAIELEDEIELIDLVKDEELVVTITSDQNIKSVSSSEYNKQKSVSFRHSFLYFSTTFFFSCCLTWFEIKVWKEGIHYSTIERRAQP